MNDSPWNSVIFRQAHKQFNDRIPQVIDFIIQWLWFGSEND
jgi:hypothetical protein